MDYIINREHLLGQLVITMGIWQETGENDRTLEDRCEELMSQLHPNRRTAIAILEKHLAMEVAA
ncbi:hypothetical protein [Planococcus dechangensis]|uniref:Uncharacterized protein n=1 Tax=Planococcus dechangensis TaxID=1176255 RepID=A0ABV9M8Y0_9BACL